MFALQQTSTAQVLPKMSQDQGSFMCNRAVHASAIHVLMRTPTPHLIPEMPPLRPCVDLAPSLRAKVLLKTLVGLILTAFKILVVLAAPPCCEGSLCTLLSSCFALFKDDRRVLEGPNTECHASLMAPAWSVSIAVKRLTSKEGRLSLQALKNTLAFSILVSWSSMHNDFAWSLMVSFFASFAPGSRRPRFVLQAPLRSLAVWAAERAENRYNQAFTTEAAHGFPVRS